MLESRRNMKSNTPASTMRTEDGPTKGWTGYPSAGQPDHDDVSWRGECADRPMKRTFHTTRTTYLM